jgi:hypothetical protein
VYIRRKVIKILAFHKTDKLENTMEKSYKIQIFKSMIQYLLESDYTLKNIADLTGFSIKNIRAIYFEDCMVVENHLSEIRLVKLFNIFLEMQIKKNAYSSKSPIEMQIMQRAPYAVSTE